MCEGERKGVCVCVCACACVCVCVSKGGWIRRVREWNERETREIVADKREVGDGRFGD